MIPGVAGKAVLKTLLEHDPQRFVKREIHIDRRRVMVRPILPPIVADERHVQIPAGNLGSSLFDRGKRPGSKGHGRQAGRTTQALLRAAVNRVELPGVDFNGHSSERCHAVHQQQPAGIVDDFGNFFQWLPGAGRGLRMHDAHDFGRVPLDRLGNLVG